MAKPSVDTLVNADKMTLKDVYTLYENGKGRRYNLLFSVNGAALAILSFLAKDARNGALAGVLALAIAGLMIVFTWLMRTDIHSFGANMARLGGPLGLFGPVGQRVLNGLTALLITAWIGVIAFGAGLLAQ